VAVVHWHAAGPLKPSVIKPLITTIEARLVLCHLGHLHADDQKALHQTLALVIGLTAPRGYFDFRGRAGITSHFLRGWDGVVPLGKSGVG
jgi:hypothetical protein